VNGPQGERGSVAVETAVIAPALVALLLLVVFAGRVSHLDSAVQRAAAEGARAASLHDDPLVADEASSAAVAANLAANAVPCAHLEVSTGTSDLRPGGSISVTVRCVADMTDVALLGVPGSRTFVATSHQVVDRFRGGLG